MKKSLVFKARIASSLLIILSVIVLLAACQDEPAQSNGEEEPPLSVVDNGGSLEQGEYLSYQTIMNEHDGAGNPLLRLDNGTITLGIDLSWGGAIAYLANNADGVNMINRHDSGRLIQQSYYGAGLYGGIVGQWGYNPVQGGDGRFGSDVLAFYADDDLVYIKTQPLDFLLNQVRARSYMENWYRVEGNLVHVTSRFTNLDNHPGPIRHQELPAIFTNSEQNQFIRYSGSEPYTNGELTVINPGFPNKSHEQSEAWGAHVDGTGSGIGWVTPHIYGSTSYMYSGGGGSGEFGDTTSYTAPVYSFGLMPQQVYQYEYHLVAGNVEETRSLAVDRTWHTASFWKFDTDGERQGWSQTLAMDGVGPEEGLWSFSMQEGQLLQLSSPPLTFLAAERPIFHVTVDNGIGAEKMTLEWAQVGDGRATSGAFPYQVEVALSPNPGLQTIEVSLSDEGNWEGLIRSVRLRILAEENGDFAIKQFGWLPQNRHSDENGTVEIDHIVAHAAHANMAVIRWTTDRPASSQVLYGLTPNALTMATPHHITLGTQQNAYASFLKADTTYYYQVRSMGVDGYWTVSDTAEFTTPKVKTEKLGRVQLTYPIDEIVPGEVITSQVLAMTDSGEMIDLRGADISYTSLSEQLATINSNGQITAKATGKAMLSIEVKWGEQTITSAMPLHIVRPEDRRDTTIGGPRTVLSEGAEDAVTSLNWKFSDGLQGWTEGNHVALQTAAGEMQVRIRGADAYIFSPRDLYLSAREAPMLSITLRNETESTDALVYFITEGDTAWNTDKFVRIPIDAAMDDWKTYTLDMSANANWRGLIQQIRIDPVKGASGGIVAYKEIAAHSSE